MFKREIVAILILIIIALVRLLFFIPEAPAFDNFIGQEIEFTGIISDDPDIRLNNQHLNIEIKKLNANVLVFTDRENKFNYGDEVSVSGILEEPENFITSAGKEFNYQRYLANQNIYFIVKNAEVKTLSCGHGNFLKTFLFRIKNAFIKSISQIIPIPESDLASGLILGIKGGFDDDLKQEFIDTGTIHIVALSGYNVSIIVESIIKILNKVLSLTISSLAGILVIILFVIMTGASATAVRAGIMATIMLLGRITGRPYMAGRALIITALLMIAYDPRIFTDMSFELSFLATAGVLFVTPKVMKWFRFVPMRFGMREIFASTTSATIAVLPMLLYLTGNLSFVSFPANILILPFIPLAMLFSFITGILNFISSILAIPVGYVSYLILHYILTIIHEFSLLSFAGISVINFPLIITIIIYLLLAWCVFRKK